MSRGYLSLGHYLRELQGEGGRWSRLETCMSSYLKMGIKSILYMSVDNFSQLLTNANKDHSPFLTFSNSAFPSKTLNSAQRQPKSKTTNLLLVWPLKSRSPFVVSSRKKSTFFVYWTGYETSLKLLKTSPLWSPLKRLIQSTQGSSHMRIWKCF